MPLVVLAIPSVLIGYLTIGPVLFGGYFGSVDLRAAERNDVVAEIGRGVPRRRRRSRCTRSLTPPFWLALRGRRHRLVPVPAAARTGRRDCASAVGWLYALLVNKYYFDWFNENVLARAARGLGSRCGAAATRRSSTARWSTARPAPWAGSPACARRVQTGYLYSYAFWMIIGLALLLGWFLVRA